MYFGLSGISKEGSKQYTDTQTPYTSTPEPKTKTTTITETTTYTQPPVTKTVTETETVTKTVTKTKTVTETKTETLTKPSSTTTTTTTAQHPITLEEIVFGNSNLKFMPLEVLDAKIVDNYARLKVRSPHTKKIEEIEILDKYVSGRNKGISINIEDIVSKVKEYNLGNGIKYTVYFVLGRANINKAIRHNSGWALDGSITYHNIIISDGSWEDVYNALESVINNKASVLILTLYKCTYPKCLVTWSNQPINDHNRVMAIYQNEQQANKAKKAVKLVNYVLGTPDEKNPSDYGILHAVTVAKLNNKGTYEDRAALVTIKEHIGTHIVFIHQEGNYIVSNW